MKKQRVNYIIDFLIFMAFLITVFSGLAMKIFMPSGIRRGGFQEFLGVEKSAWLNIHDVAGILMTVLIVVHLILHWQWIAVITKNILKPEKDKIILDKK